MMVMVNTYKLNILLSIHDYTYDDERRSEYPFKVPWVSQRGKDG
ncbi:hypothetical protein O9992_00805 [Vibrio lentus]|nr:hypothetical protein [Vibrio lentus]